MRTAASAPLFRALLAGAPEARIGSLAQLRDELAQTPADDSLERAALAGFSAAALEWAFAAGYACAMARLDPGGRGKLTALAATEEGGAHPRAIRTSLVQAADGSWSLTGSKSFVTLGSEVDDLLVVASVGTDANGRNRLRVARLPVTRPGVQVAPMPTLPVAPDVPHARLSFERVAVAPAEILPGDGYDDFVKPFRTIEDVHVVAASLGWGVAVARRSDWAAGWVDGASALLAALVTVAGLPPAAPETHAVLGGILDAAARLFEGGEWVRTPDAVRAAWERDRALFQVASKARAARREAAHRALGGRG